jgi:transposase
MLFHNIIYEQTMHLSSHTRKKNGKTYKYYSIAESYWEDGKNKKRILKYLGALPPLQAQQVRNALKATQSVDTFVATFGDLLFVDHWRYLDVAFLNHLWDKEWRLSDIFPLPRDSSKTRKKDVPTADVAKILTFCRCLDPGSYLSVVEWFGTTACNHIVGVDGVHFNESRVYRELTVIEQQKERIESWLYQTLIKRDKESMRIIFYDLSDSYFEGKKCALAKPGRTKANGFRDKRIILSILVNSEGYPFSWEILEDYTSDVGTLKGNSDRWKQKFDFSGLIMVFDRGMVSDENLRHLEGGGYLYITAMDKDQIAGVDGSDLERFKDFTDGTTEKEMLSKGFSRYDDVTYYCDLGVANNGRRHVLLFNRDLWKAQRKTRETLIEIATRGLEEEKESLLNAKRSRELKATITRIDKSLEKLGMKNYLDYNLEEVYLTGKTGSAIGTFDLSYQINKKAIEKAQLTDGVWMIVTNISEDVEPEECRLGPEELVKAYRDKNRVEEAFKEVKSFLKFQPTFVYTDEHVRAHYTICTLSYLLDVTVTNKLRENPIKAAGSAAKVHSTLKRCELGKISVKDTDHSGKKLMPLTKAQESILKLFDCGYLVEGRYLRSIGV